MNTFKYQKGNCTLYIRDDYGDLRVVAMDEHNNIGITLDRAALDMLRNYLDDLECGE